jgi:hypothetical protein
MTRRHISADVVREMRRHPLAEIHPRFRRASLLRLLRRQRDDVYVREFRIA